MWLELQAQVLAVPNKIIGLSITLAAVALVFVWAERKFPLHPQKTLRKSWLIDVGYFYIGAIVPAFVLLLLMHLTTALLSPLGAMPWHAWVAELPAPAAFLASTLLSEIAYYWAHRMAHQIPFSGASIRFTTAPPMWIGWSTPAPIRWTCHLCGVLFLSACMCWVLAAACRNGRSQPIPFL